MVKKFTTKLIPLIEINFVHQWENNKSKLWNKHNWKKKELGLWYKKSFIVGRPTTGMAVNEIFNENNLVKGYSFGINLIICKFWILLAFKKIMDI